MKWKEFRQWESFDAMFASVYEGAIYVDQTLSIIKPSSVYHLTLGLVEIIIGI